jgi:hypothetical protein
VKPGELVWMAGGKQLRGLDVVDTPERESRYEGLLRVERT